MAQHFLQLEDYATAELELLLDKAVELKALYLAGGSDLCLTGRTMALLFEKPSSRTRLSFEVAMSNLGGNCVYLRAEDIGGLGKREPIKDLARMLNSYVDVVVVRTFGHDHIEDLACYSNIPVVNALTDKVHPCQAMADMLTVKEALGHLDGLRMAFIGDGNNVAASLAVACKRLGVQLALATPAGYGLCEDFVGRIQAQEGAGEIICTPDPVEAARGADVIYTDTWVSMGQESEREQRMRAFSGFQVNQQLLEKTGKDTKVMHCLPAYRCYEITDDVVESPASIIFPQAENRLHFQRALVKYLMCEVS